MPDALINQRGGNLFMTKTDSKTDYGGFEQGPIRPPSEASSLLLRVTRNCPWNRCSFCPVYKGARFSLRPPAHVKRDIDAVADQLAAIQDTATATREISMARLGKYFEELPEPDRIPFQAALSWLSGGCESVFLQDADSLVVRPQDMVEILLHLKSRFPAIKRITSYARSRTIAGIGIEDLRTIADAGLDRIHIGMESASDAVLALVSKGTTKAQHIEAGLAVIEAGMELSEYVMPGLGGRALSASHVEETADALSRINPHFIRLRTLAVPPSAPIHRDLAEGRFEKLTDLEVAEEILNLIESLDGVTSRVKSDHILNLFEEIDGKLPEDKEAMTDTVRRFLALPAGDRVIFQVGRRLGRLRRISDIDDPGIRGEVESLIEQYGITSKTVDALIDSLMNRFI